VDLSRLSSGLFKFGASCLLFVPSLLVTVVAGALLLVLLSAWWHSGDEIKAEPLPMMAPRQATSDAPAMLEAKLKACFGEHLVGFKSGFDAERGKYVVEVQFDSNEGTSTKKAIEERTAEAYKIVFTSGLLPVREAWMSAYCPPHLQNMIVKDSSWDMVYETSLTADQAHVINWNDTPSAKVPASWRQHSKLPPQRQE